MHLDTDRVRSTTGRWLLGALVAFQLALLATFGCGGSGSGTKKIVALEYPAGPIQAAGVYGASGTFLALAAATTNPGFLAATSFTGVTTGVFVAPDKFVLYGTTNDSPPLPFYLSGTVVGNRLLAVVMRTGAGTEFKGVGTLSEDRTQISLRLGSASIDLSLSGPLLAGGSQDETVSYTYGGSEAGSCNTTGTSSPVSIIGDSLVAYLPQNLAGIVVVGSSAMLVARGSYGPTTFDGLEVVRQNGVVGTGSGTTTDFRNVSLTYNFCDQGCSCTSTTQATGTGTLTAK